MATDRLGNRRILRHAGAYLFRAELRRVLRLMPASKDKRFREVRKA